MIVDVCKVSWLKSFQYKNGLFDSKPIVVAIISQKNKKWIKQLDPLTCQMWISKPDPPAFGPA